MTTKNKILLQAANVLLCAAIILLTAFFMSGWSVLVQAAFYAVAAAGLAAEAVFLFIKKEFLIKLTFIAELIAGVLLSRRRLYYSVFGLGNTCVARDNRRVCDACRVVLQISEKI